MRALLVAIFAAALLGCGEADNTGQGGHPMVRMHVKAKGATGGGSTGGVQSGE